MDEHDRKIVHSTTAEGTGEWETPDLLFRRLDHRFHFSIDLAASAENHKVERYYDIEDSALTQDWGIISGFLNPPYDQCAAFLRQVVVQTTLFPSQVVALVPARTDTRWWHDYAMKADEIWLIKGRLKFELKGIPGDAAPFPSAILLFKRRSTLTPIIGGWDWLKHDVP